MKMTDLESAVGSLLALAQLALAVIAVDAVLGYWMDMAFLSGGIKHFAYAGGLVGVLDQLYWLVTERIPKLMDSMY